MTTRLRSVNPVQLGLFMAVFYLLVGAVVALFMAPFMAMMASYSHQAGPMSFGFFGMVMMVIVYAIFGFIGGVIAAFIYNIVAGWTGGVEMTFVNVVHEVPPPGSAVMTAP